MIHLHICTYSKYVCAVEPVHSLTGVDVHIIMCGTENVPNTQYASLDTVQIHQSVWLHYLHTCCMDPLHIAWTHYTQHGSTTHSMDPLHTAWIHYTQHGSTTHSMDPLHTAWTHYTQHGSTTHSMDPLHIAWTHYT